MFCMTKFNVSHSVQSFQVSITNSNFYSTLWRKFSSHLVYDPPLSSRLRRCGSKTLTWKEREAKPTCVSKQTVFRILNEQGKTRNTCTYVYSFCSKQKNLSTDKCGRININASRININVNLSLAQRPKIINSKNKRCFWLCHEVVEC